MWPYAANMTDAEMRQYAVDYGAKPSAMPAARPWVDPPADPALIARGKEIAARGLPGEGACNSCHGIEGQSGAFVPSIAGQNPVFLRNQLRAMRDDARGATGGYNPMGKEVHGASDEDIAALAAGMPRFRRVRICTRRLVANAVMLICHARWWSVGASGCRRLKPSLATNGKGAYNDPLERISSMPLYIKDPEVDRLATELIGLTNASKVDAVRDALKDAVARRKAKLPMRERLARTLAMAQAAGPFHPGNHKRETDEMWGEHD